jgi:hypothetical protein
MSDKLEKCRSIVVKYQDMARSSQRAVSWSEVKKRCVEKEKISCFVTLLLFLGPQANIADPALGTAYKLARGKAEGLTQKRRGF